MRRLFFALSLAGILASSALAQVELKDGRVWLNGIRRDDTVWVRSCFKLAAPVTYHFTGQGGGRYGLGSARAWVDEQIALGFDGCRVLLETEGWSACETGSQVNDGIPQGCMFGSEPRDQGFWEVDRLRSGGRPTSMHGVGKNVLRWFFETSQETGFLFELVAVATLKHNDVSVAQQTHVIRQTLTEAYRLQQEFPQANILMNAINEWNAHSRWTLPEVNQLAVRADRWKHPDGRTAVGCSAPAGFEPEQWPCGPIIVDGGGGNTFDFDVGPEPGKFDMGAVHPERDDGWERFPNAAQKARLVQDSRGQPWGFTESMFLVEQEDLPRARQWYPGQGDRWTADWGKYESFLAHVEAISIPYFAPHDEKGVQSVVGWPRAETRLDRWAREHLGGDAPPPPPDNPPPPEPPPTGEAYAKLGGPDLEGRYSVTLVLPDWPRFVQGIDDSSVVTERYDIALPFAMRLYAADSFIGLDRGDVGEFAIEIDDARSGMEGYQRSEHKETDVMFNSFDPQFRYMTTDRLAVWVTARVTGPSSRTRKWEARPHFAGYVYGHQFGAVEPPDEPDEPPDPEKKATDYIPLADRAEWVARVDHAYTPWRGDRDLAYLAANGEVVEAFGFDPGKLAGDVAALLSIHEERNALSHRVETAGTHPDFADRLRVRKEIVHDFVRRAGEVQRTSYRVYGEAAARMGVNWGDGFDSWRGFILAPTGWAKWWSTR